MIIDESSDNSSNLLVNLIPPKHTPTDAGNPPSSHVDESTPKIENSDYSEDEKLENFFRIFCVINVVSFFVIIFFLRKHVCSWKSLSPYRIYCLALACSDLILSIDGFFAVSEIDSFFTDQWVLQG